MLRPISPPVAMTAMATPITASFTTCSVVPIRYALTRQPSDPAQLPSELDQLTPLGHLQHPQAEQVAHGALVGFAATCSSVLVGVLLAAMKFLFLVVLAVEN